MSDETRGSEPASLSLPDAANLHWLRKQAKHRLQEMRRSHPEAKLADAQFALAKAYGFTSWRALKAHVDSLTLDGKLFAAARSGDVPRLKALLDEHPLKLSVREPPYGWTLLHASADHGQLGAVDLLLQLGLDVNTREQGDNTYAMHWAAATGALEVVRRLADAGGDVIGHGDDHELEVIGWASCWDGGDDAAHRAIVDFLVTRGARHHIFSAIAMNLGDEVRRIVAADPEALSRRMSRNEDHQQPLHFAVRKNRPDMVRLLLELGADPNATDGGDMPAITYAGSPNVGNAVVEALARGGPDDVFSAFVLGDEARAARLLDDMRHDPAAAGASAGALHLMARRGDTRGVKWLLDHGVDPNTRWSYWRVLLTPLHLATLEGHVAVVRVLLDAGADPAIRDTKYHGDARGWAEHGGHMEIVRLLDGYRSGR